MGIQLKMLKNWPLFGQKFSTFGQSIQPHSHVNEVLSIFPTNAKKGKKIIGHYCADFCPW